MGISVRTFWELLPYRLDQALVGPRLRKARLRHRRRRTIQALPRSGTGIRRLFVDLSVISKHDAGTGIQRVVRALALSLIEIAPAQGWELHFVAATRRKAYRHITWPEPSEPFYSEEMEGRPGDIFLGLDYSLDAVRRHAGQLSRFRRKGGSVWFLIHDLLPLERPDWFGRNMEVRYKAWIEILASISDGFLCNSDHTEDKLRHVLSYYYGISEGYKTKALKMGHSILESVQKFGAESKTISSRSNIPDLFFLMVGTLEPRKGHGDVIGAFDALWQTGLKEGLVLVGREGWQVEGLCERILRHPFYGKKLFWFDDVDDLELERFYAACQGSVIASYAEGFGLPLIEALGHGKPVLARDLAVFRPHAKNGVCYFPIDANTQVLAQCIKHWAENVRSGHITVIRPDSSWDQSARDLMSTIA